MFYYLMLNFLFVSFIFSNPVFPREKTCIHNLTPILMVYKVHNIHIKMEWVAIETIITSN